MGSSPGSPLVTGIICCDFGLELKRISDVIHSYEKTSKVSQVSMDEP
jgi:hypothetical protein